MDIFWNYTLLPNFNTAKAQLRHSIGTALAQFNGDFGTALAQLAHD